MVISIHQSHYLPWLGYFDKVDSADVFVLLDTVQFEKNGWQNRNKIKTAQGPMWLTVPVFHEFGASIDDITINNSSKWRKKHFLSLKGNYSKAPYFSKHEAFFNTLYDSEWESLAVLNDRIFRYLLDVIGIKTKIVTASSMDGLPDDPNERLAAIVNQLGGDIYLAGSGSRAYIDKGVFERDGIGLVFQDFQSHDYTQLFGAFEPGMAAIDALFNCGDETAALIRKGRRTEL